MGAVTEIRFYKGYALGYTPVRLTKVQEEAVVRLLGYSKIKGGSRECYSDEILKKFMEMDENPLKSENIKDIIDLEAEK